MPLHFPSSPFAKNLRRRQTSAEIFLWHHLRNRRFFQYKFRRQFAIHPYIVDFCCLEKRLIIELDGAQHLQAITYDQKRDVFLKNLGFHVLRFWNRDLNENLPAVLRKIQTELQRR